jgi:dihydrofolate reductase
MLVVRPTRRDNDGRSTAMRKIVAVERTTLDGVMQAPGGKDEDRRDGFQHGGWGSAYNDEVIGAEMGKGMGHADLLLGRRTYQILFDYWPKQDPESNPFTKVLNETTKYVASRTLKEPLPWANSTLLDGDAALAVTRLKQQDGRDLAIIGSGELVRSLMRSGLIDELTLLIHPLVLGSGRRLLDHEAPSATLTLAHSVTSPTGVVIATYRRS